MYFIKHKLKNKSRKTKLLDLYYISDKNQNDSIMCTSHHTQGMRKNRLNTPWTCSKFGSEMPLYINTDSWKHSQHYTILLNWKKIEQVYNLIFKELCWMPPSQPILTRPPIWTSLLKWKKLQPPSNSKSSFIVYGVGHYLEDMNQ